MIRTAIVEDERTNGLILKNYLEKYGEENGFKYSITLFSNGVEFISDYTPEYDLVFMDIDMPHMSGLETAKIMRKLDSTVTLAFVTNLAKYAINGYDVEAVAFIVKPLNYSAFSIKMQRIMAHVKPEAEPYLTVSTKDSISKVNLSDIYYITVMGRYVMLHTKTGDLVMHKSMKELEKELEDYSFVRGDNSSMVNLRYVTAITNEGAVVNGRIIPYSRNRKKVLLDAFTLYLR